MAATTTRSLLGLTAENLMCRHLVLIPLEMSLPAAAHVLCQAGVSGAPVVDSEGRCVGVLSAMDFLRWGERQCQPTDHPARESVGSRAGAGTRANGNRGPAAGRPQSCICADWQMVEVKGLPSEAVREHMTSDPAIVAPGTPIAVLAR